MKYKEIMQGIDKNTAIRFVGYFKSLNDPHRYDVGQFDNDIYKALGLIGIRPSKKCANTANAVLERMLRKAGMETW
jgi:hypothetical protein